MPRLDPYGLGWKHHPHISWETNENTLQPPHEKMTNLEEVMIKLAKSHVEFANSQAQFTNETREILQI